MLRLQPLGARFSYADGPTAVVVTRGVLARSVRTVPNDRIRGVEVEAPVLHQIFGLVRVRIGLGAVDWSSDESYLLIKRSPEHKSGDLVWIPLPPFRRAAASRPAGPRARGRP